MRNASTFQNGVKIFPIAFIHLTLVDIVFGSIDALHWAMSCHILFHGLERKRVSQAVKITDIDHGQWPYFLHHCMSCETPRNPSRANNSYFEPIRFMLMLESRNICLVLNCENVWQFVTNKCWQTNQSHDDPS